MLKRYEALYAPWLARLHRRTSRRIDPARYDGIFVLGNQKTGSTAIAHLLARYAGLSLCSYVRPMARYQKCIVNGTLPLARFVQAQRYYFRAEVVKDNELTLFTDQVHEIFPHARLLYIVRDPYQNIRSILDRLDLPGQCQHLDTLDIADGGWKMVVDNRWQGFRQEDSIRSLAMRWQQCAELAPEMTARCLVIRYEDFLADKERKIAEVAGFFELGQVNEITDLCVKRFQPRGRHRDLASEAFFSQEALDIIAKTCRDGMRRFGYASL